VASVITSSTPACACTGTEVGALKLVQLHLRHQIEQRVAAIHHGRQRDEHDDGEQLDRVHGISLGVSMGSALGCGFGAGCEAIPAVLGTGRLPLRVHW
jgi:hypothetical protein